MGLVHDLPQTAFESKKSLGDALAPIFKQRGWAKQALNWRKTERDTVLVFHVEKNRWGAERFSLHCGVYLKALGQELAPPYYRCPVQATVDRIAPDRDYVERITDFDEPSVHASDRLGAIVDVVEAYAIPWLERHATLDALKRLVASDYDDLLRRILISRAAYDYLRGLNDEG